MTSYELYISFDGLGAAFSGLFLMIPDLGPEHGVRNLSSSDNLFPVTAAAHQLSLLTDLRLCVSQIYFVSIDCLVLLGYFRIMIDLRCNKSDMNVSIG